MEQEETTLHIELIVGITDQIGLSVADRLEQTDVDVVDHSLTADPAWDYERCFDIDLKVDRPVDQLVALARENIPSSVAAAFSIWRRDEEGGEEVARLNADPLPGLFSG